MVTMMMMMMTFIMIMEKMLQPLATFGFFFTDVFPSKTICISPILSNNSNIMVFFKAIVIDLSKLPLPITEAVAIGKFLQLAKFWLLPVTLHSLVILVTSLLIVCIKSKLANHRSSSCLVIVIIIIINFVWGHIKDAPRGIGGPIDWNPRRMVLITSNYLPHHQNHRLLKF